MLGKVECGQGRVGGAPSVVASLPAADQTVRGNYARAMLDTTITLGGQTAGPQRQPCGPPTFPAGSHDGVRLRETGLMSLPTDGSQFLPVYSTG